MPTIMGTNRRSIAPKMAPCSTCGLLFTSGSLRFHERTCTQRSGSGSGGTRARSVDDCSSDMDLIGIGGISHVPSEGEYEGDTDGVTLAPLFDHTAADDEDCNELMRELGVREGPTRSEARTSLSQSPPPLTRASLGQREASLSPSVSPPPPPSDSRTFEEETMSQHAAPAFQPCPAQRWGTPSLHNNGSSYDKSSPLTTCVLVDGELAPILPVKVPNVGGGGVSTRQHVELIVPSTPTPEPDVVVPVPQERSRSQSTSRAPSASSGRAESFSNRSTQPPSPVTYPRGKEGKEASPQQRQQTPPAALRMQANVVDHGEARVPLSGGGGAARRSRSRSPSASVAPQLPPSHITVSAHRKEIDNLKSMMDERIAQTKAHHQSELAAAKQEHAEILSTERLRFKQRLEAEVGAGGARQKGDEKAVLIQKQTREIDQLRTAMKTLENERSALRASKKWFSGELQTCKDELLRLKEEGESSKGATHAHKQAQQEVASLTAEVARLKGEVQREKTKAEKLQHVLKSRSTQQQATVEKRTATCDQWEQKLASESETLRKEKEAAAHTKALQDRLQKELDRRSKEVEEVEVALQTRSAALDEGGARLEAAARRVEGERAVAEERERGLARRDAEALRESSRATAEARRLVREKARLDALQDMLTQREASLEKEHRPPSQPHPRLSEALLHDNNRPIPARHTTQKNGRSVSPTVASVATVGMMSPGMRVKADPRRMSGEQSVSALRGGSGSSEVVLGGRRRRSTTAASGVSGVSGVSLPTSRGYPDTPNALPRPHTFLSQAEPERTIASIRNKAEKAEPNPERHDSFVHRIVGTIMRDAAPDTVGDDGIGSTLALSDLATVRAESVFANENEGSAAGGAYHPIPVAAINLFTPNGQRARSASAAH